MRGRLQIIAAAFSISCPGVVWADSAEVSASDTGAELPAYLQCVPFARERSGVQIYGDARTWWDQAAGRYKRGSRPRPGAVMTFQPSGAMTLGHVAAVAKVIDSRTVLIDHANWSPIDGRRGQIERGVKAVDVSPANDWSEVRVWYDPLQGLGTTAWPVAGFIYNEPDNGTPFGGERVLANASYAPTAAIASKPSKAFAQAFAGLGEPAGVKTPPQRLAVAAPARQPTRRVAAPEAPRPRDPIDQAIARYSN